MDDDYDDYAYYNEEDEFGLERDVHMRVGMATGIDRSYTLADASKFEKYVNATARMIQDKNHLPMTQPDINKIIEATGQVHLPQHKNATAFVLGYIMLKNGKMDKARFDKIKTVLPLIEYTVQPADVIRYAKMWINIMAAG